MQVSVSSVSSVAHDLQEQLTAEDTEDTENTLTGNKLPSRHSVSRESTLPEVLVKARSRLFGEAEPRTHTERFAPNAHNSRTRA
jgi:hypothetical protein